MTLGSRSHSSQERQARNDFVALWLKTHRSPSASTRKEDNKGSEDDESDIDAADEENDSDETEDGGDAEDSDDNEDDDEDEDENDDDTNPDSGSIYSAKYTTSCRGVAPADGAGLNDYLWPPHKDRLKVRFLNGSSWEKDTVKHLVTKHYHAIPMRIRFEFLEKGASGPSDIRLTFADVSEAYIGRAAETHPGQPTMWLNMHPRGSSTEAKRLKRQADVLHEFGHALGMIHEQQHPDCRANWNYRILQARHGWDDQQVRRAYDKVAARQTVTPYDPQSVMHYPVAKGDTESCNMVVSQNSVLSEGDKRFLMVIYPAQQDARPKSKPERKPKSAIKPKSKPTPKPKPARELALTKKPDRKPELRIDNKPREKRTQKRSRKTDSGSSVCIININNNHTINNNININNNNTSSINAAISRVAVSNGGSRISVSNRVMVSGNGSVVAVSGGGSGTIVSNGHVIRW